MEWQEFRRISGGPKSRTVRTEERSKGSNVKDSAGTVKHREFLWDLDSELVQSARDMVRFY